MEELVKLQNQVSNLEQAIRELKAILIVKKDTVKRVKKLVKQLDRKDSTKNCAKTVQSKKKRA